MGIESVVYHALTDESEKELEEGWCKDTVDYVLEHRSSILRHIGHLLNRHSNSVTCRVKNANDSNDIYQELLNYCYKNGDYNIYKAFNADRETNKVLSLEAFVKMSLKYVVLRFISNEAKSSKNNLLNSYTYDDEGNERSVLDDIASNIDEYDKISYKLTSICESYAYGRYDLGIDVFMFLYIKLKTLDDLEVSKNIFNVLGVTKKDLSELEDRAINNEMLKSFVKALSETPIELSLSILRSRVYSADRVDKLIEICTMMKDVAV